MVIGHIVCTKFGDLVVCLFNLFGLVKRTTTVINEINELINELIGHVRYINILTRLRGFRVKLLYLVLFSLYPSLFWEFKDKRQPRPQGLLLDDFQNGGSSGEDPGQR